MTFSFSLSTNVGKVRNMIGDVDSSTALMSDEEIDAMISMYSGDLFSAAAACLRRMAAQLSRTAKSITAGDYSENTSQQPKAMLEAAQALEDMAKNIPADAMVEVIYDQFSYDNIVQNKILRGESLDG